MELKTELKKIIMEDREVLYYVFRDTIITYIKLILMFPKQLNERNLFMKYMLQFEKSIMEEIRFLNYLINLNDVDKEKIYEILDDLDITFEQEYLYYDDIINYMEKCIDNKDLNFCNNLVPKKDLVKKIRLYQNDYLK